MMRTLVRCASGVDQGRTARIGVMVSTTTPTVASTSNPQAPPNPRSPHRPARVQGQRARAGSAGDPRVVGGGGESPAGDVIVLLILTVSRAVSSNPAHGGGDGVEALGSRQGPPQRWRMAGAGSRRTARCTEPETVRDSPAVTPRRGDPREAARARPRGLCF